MLRASRAVGPNRASVLLLLPGTETERPRLDQRVRQSGVENRVDINRTAGHHNTPWAIALILATLLAPLVRCRSQRRTLRGRQLDAGARSRRAAVHELLARGLSRDAVAGELNVYIHTVRRFADAERAEEPSAKAECRSARLDLFMDLVNQRWNEGVATARAIRVDHRSFLTEIVVERYPEAPLTYLNLSKIHCICALMIHAVKITRPSVLRRG
jgi:hypothetical protein